MNKILKHILYVVSKFKFSEFSIFNNFKYLLYQYILQFKLINKFFNKKTLLTVLHVKIVGSLKCKKKLKNFSTSFFYEKTGINN